MTIDDKAEISLPLAKMEDVWGNLGSLYGYEVGEREWQTITGMASFIYGDVMAVSGVDAETAKRYFLMAMSDRDDVPHLEQDEGVDSEVQKIIKTQGNIVLACLKEKDRYSPEDSEYLMLRQMAKDLFENNLFSIDTTPSGSEYVISSLIDRSGLKGKGQESWVIRNIGGKNHITPVESGTIGRVCFSPTIVGVPGAERRRCLSLKGDSPERVFSKNQGQLGVKIEYKTYEPKRLPSCWIEVRTQTNEPRSPLGYSLKIDEKKS